MSANYLVTMNDFGGCAKPVEPEWSLVPAGQSRTVSLELQRCEGQAAVTEKGTITLYSPTGKRYDSVEAIFDWPE